MRMSNFANHDVPVVPPASIKRISFCASQFLQKVAPDHLRKPGILNLPKLIDYDLPIQCNIRIYPVKATDLDARHEAVTRRLDRDDTEILIRETAWNELFKGGYRAHRARATVGHELGHACLHETVLALARQGDVRPYCNAEWQAWVFAGCILMPPQTLQLIKPLNPENISRTYGVSRQFAETHSKRMRKSGLL